MTKRACLCTLSLAIASVAMLTTSCTSSNSLRSSLSAAISSTPDRSSRSKPKPSSPESSIRYNQFALSQSNGSNTRLVIDVADQRGYLLVNGKVAVDTPVSTARPGKSTPRGTFYMSQRVRQGKISTIYGVEMPYWMRLSSTVYGVHAGHLPGYPASAGCVRLPSSAAQVIFDNTRSGTRVNIYSSWDGA
ncbi:MAG: L,D-transpeptidase [Verrucomicrobiota bacterium]